MEEGGLRSGQAYRPTLAAHAEADPCSRRPADGQDDLPIGALFEDEVARGQVDSTRALVQGARSGFGNRP